MSIATAATTATALTIQGNWERVSEQVSAACQRAGRAPESVTVIGVTKYVDAPLCQQLAQAGCRVFGENRPQSLWDKTAWFASQGESGVQWHMIGHLQRNKVRRTLPLIACLHSLDSLRLAEELNAAAVATGGPPLPVLIEVNVSQDSSKTGLPEVDVVPFVERAVELSGLTIHGLMAMASLEGDQDTARREFARVRQLREQLVARFPELHLPELSMGMSGDYEAAIAEGATLVRIGSSLWRGLLPDA